MKRFYQHNIDIILLGLVSFAILFGLLLLYSANHFQLSLPLKQLRKGSIFIVFLIPLLFMKDRHIQDISLPIYTFNLFLLFLVLFNGYTSKGAQRWLQIPFIRFEPSEIIKITLPLALAANIHKAGIPIRSTNLLYALVIIGLPFLLILKQPDLGTALTILMIGSIALFIAGLSRRFIIISFLSIAIASPILWQQLYPYQKQRVVTLLSGSHDLQNHGYHIHQSKIAIGSGGIWGKGIGQGSQVQLGYIPEHKTDFIFTLLSEEYGFVGNMLWLLLLLSIGFRSIYIGYQQQQLFNKISVMVLGFSFMLNAWINMAMVSGLIPIVGVPLPFLSYGATSFSINLVNFALILKLGHVDPRKQYLW